jgi:hypothetical protein
MAVAFTEWSEFCGSVDSRPFVLHLPLQAKLAAV